MSVRDHTSESDLSGHGGVALRIFLNYRREDTSFYADRLYDDLGRGSDSFDVFRDIDKIEPGADFVDVIETQLDSCDVVLALIGSQWVSLTDSRGRRRLDDPADYVRLELEKALDRGVRVIPVRVHGADMPTSAELPESLHPLVRRQAVEISDKSWRHDVDSLAAKLGQLLDLAAAREKEREEQLAREEAERERLATEEAERRRIADEETELARRAREAREQEEAARQRAIAAQAERERLELEHAEIERQRAAEKLAERERAEAKRRAREEEKRLRAEQKREEAAQRASEHERAARRPAAGDWLRRPVVLLAGGALVLLAAVGGFVVLSGEGGGVSSGDVPAPLSSSSSSVSGTARAGAGLTAKRGAWTGSPTEFAYQWRRCNERGGRCSAIDGAAGRTYTLRAADGGHRIRVAVTASNAAGSQTVVTRPTAIVAPAFTSPAIRSEPRVTGIAQVGATLAVTPGKWSGSKPITVTRAWLRCAASGSSCRPIRGATNKTYTVSSNDVGTRFRVEERASNDGVEATARSAATAIIRARTVTPEPEPTPTPTPEPEPTPVCPPDCPKPPS